MRVSKHRTPPTLREALLRNAPQHEAVFLLPSTADRGECRLTAPRRRPEHVHELSRGTEVLQVADGLNRCRDGGWAQHAVGIGAEFALDLRARERVSAEPRG